MPPAGGIRSIELLNAMRDRSFGLPRAQSPQGAKGRSFGSVVMLPSIPDVPGITAEGNDRSRVALGTRNTAHRLRVWVVPHCPAPPVPPCRVSAAIATRDGLPAYRAPSCRAGVAGSDRSRVAPGTRSTADRLRVWIASAGVHRPPWGALSHPRRLLARHRLRRSAGAARQAHRTGLPSQRRLAPCSIDRQNARRPLRQARAGLFPSLQRAHPPRRCAPRSRSLELLRRADPLSPRPRPW